MRNIFVIIILSFVLSTLFAVEAVGFRPYFNLKAGTLLSNNPDNDPVMTKLYANSNAGINWSSDSLKAQFELGRNANLRVFKATVPLWNGRLTAGQTYGSGLDKCSGQVIDPSGELDGPYPGVMFMNREFQISWSNDISSVAAFGPTKVSYKGKVTKGLPKVLASHHVKLGKIELSPVIGYAYYWTTGQQFHSGIAGLNVAFDNVQGQMFCSRNPSDFGINTIPGSGISGGDITLCGAWLQNKIGKFTLGAGYSRNNNQVEAGAAFINYAATYGKHTILTPEAGYFWGRGLLKHNTVYIGARAFISAK